MRRKYEKTSVQAKSRKSINVEMPPPSSPSTFFFKLTESRQTIGKVTSIVCYVLLPSSLAIRKCKTGTSARDIQNYGTCRITMGWRPQRQHFELMISHISFRLWMNNRLPVSFVCLKKKMNEFLLRCFCFSHISKRSRRSCRRRRRRQHRWRETLTQPRYKELKDIDNEFHADEGKTLRVIHLTWSSVRSIVTQVIRWLTASVCGHATCRSAYWQAWWPYALTAMRQIFSTRQRSTFEAGNKCVRRTGA